MSSKVVSNLLYYQVRSHTGLTEADDDFHYFQTNYFVSVALVFLTVFFFVPWKMLYIVIVLAIGSLGTDKNQSFLLCQLFPVFGAQYYMSLHHVHVKAWKKNHPTAVMFATFLIGSFLIYQVGSTYFSLGNTTNPIFPVRLVHHVLLGSLSSTALCGRPCLPPRQGKDSHHKGTILEEEEGD